MEIRPTPAQEDLIRHAIDAGHVGSAEAAAQEGLALWEAQERQRILAEFRATLDEAEASIDRGEGLVITPENAHRLVDDVMARVSARLATEKSQGR